MHTPQPENKIPAVWAALGRSLRASAVKAGYMTITALAKDTGINDKTLARYFEDPRTMKLDKLAVICRKVGVSTEDLIIALYSKEEK